MWFGIYIGIKWAYIDRGRKDVFKCELFEVLYLLYNFDLIPYDFG